MFCGIIKKKRKEITMAKNKTKEVKYYLDETDQIEVDGHTLSRLYLAPDQSLSREFIESLGFAIYGEDNSDRILGGHVESLKTYLRMPTYIIQSHGLTKTQKFTVTH